MRSMGKTNILISGAGGLGIEIAKNIVLSGVKRVVLHDTKTAELADLSSQFYLTENDIQKNRAQVSAPKLAALNQNVVVDSDTGPLDAAKIKQFQVSIIIQSNTFLECLVFSPSGSGRS